MRRELRDRRAQRAARQHADEYPEILDAGNDLFDADRGDIELRQIHAQVRIALVGADDDSARFRDGKIGAGHARVGLEKVRPRVLALAFREIVDVAVRGVGADGFGKHPGDVGAQLVDRGHDDVARRLVVELLDALAQDRSP